MGSVSATVSSQETIGNRVRRLARDGYGHEDIVVLLKAEGLRISANGKERIRQMVLKRTTPAQAGALSGRFSARDGAEA